ncbi:MAG TPA: GGDEF domain-containing protein, partial [Steroidobacteraceae bacterium]|nr:GGDEF domain-containing protein [Steroidobacteraceae bacterium]
DVLRETFRDSDILARIGGDEFVALAHVTRDTNALRERLRENLVKFNQTHREPYRLDVSIGTTVVNVTNDDDIEAMIARADAAMYEEKRAMTGKHKVIAGL